MTLFVRGGILMVQLVYNAPIVHIIILSRVNARTSIQTVKLGACQMEIALLVLKDMVTLQQKVKLSMAYVLCITVQIYPWTLIVRFSSRENNVNNVLKVSF